MLPKKSDHRIKVTEMLIRRSFTELLRQKPIQSISVKELCEKASINRGTFYAHYTDIYDLLSRLEDELIVDFEEALDPLLTGTGANLTPLKITLGIFKCIKENADICAVTLGPFGDKEFAARIIAIGREKYIEMYTAFFSGVSHQKLEYYYNFISAGCIGLLERWIKDDMSISIEEIAKICEDIMMHGIGFLVEK